MTDSRPPQVHRLGQRGVVLGVVLVAVSVVDRLGGVAPGEGPAPALAVDVVVGAGVPGEVGGLVDEGSALGVSAGGGSRPEGTAEVDVAEAIVRGRR